MLFCFDCLFEFGSIVLDVLEMIVYSAFLLGCLLVWVVVGLFILVCGDCCGALVIGWLMGLFNLCLICVVRCISLVTDVLLFGWLL